MLRYLSHGARHLSMDELRETVAEVLKEDEAMATIAETLIEQGRNEGIIEGMRTNLLQSIEIFLELKFGTDGMLLLPEIQQLNDINLLQQIQNSMRTVNSLDEVRAIYQSQPQAVH